MPGFDVEAPRSQIAVSDGPLLPGDISLLTPSHPDEPLDVLRARYDRDGMLLLKGLLPREDILRTRCKYFELVGPTGLLKENTAPVQGIFNPNQSPDDFPGIGAGAVAKNGRPGSESAAAFVDLALEAHYKDWYAEDLCRHPVLRDFVAKFTGWNEHTLGLRRTLLRNNVPRTKPIGVHYDQIFLRYGEPTSVTAWVPIGDVGVTGGGLIYLEDGILLSPGLFDERLFLLIYRIGDAVGLEIEQDFTKKAREAGLTEEEAKNGFNQNMMSTGFLSEKPLEFARQHGRRWLVSDYEAGDVVLHKPHAVCVLARPLNHSKYLTWCLQIHASTINNDPNNVIRLATDLRFVDSSKPYDTVRLPPFLSPLGYAMSNDSGQRWTNHYRFGDGV